MTAPIPVVDFAWSHERLGREIDHACREVGFFAVSGHDVDPALIPALRAASAAFFARPEASKAEIAMPRAGSAWRGWFPLGGELTSGVPDGKEGIYFGTELAVDDARVVAGRPLHGPNQFPAEPAELRDLVLATIAELQRVGVSTLAAMATGLGLDAGWFASHLTADPTVLFRIFRYPPQRDAVSIETGAPETVAPVDHWGVREHTDYGLVTVLAHDGTPGLEVHTPDGWVDAPTDPELFIVNVGDMLERLTGGRYRSTPHRVRNTSPHDRYSFPLFLDPSWDVEVVPLPLDATPAAPGRARWDGGDPLAWNGSYGEYLTSRVAKVFPALFEQTGFEQTGFDPVNPRRAP